MYTATAAFTMHHNMVRDHEPNIVMCYALCQLQMLKAVQINAAADICCCNSSRSTGHQGLHSCCISCSNKSLSWPCIPAVLAPIAEGEHKGNLTTVTELRWAHKFPNHKQQKLWSATLCWQWGSDPGIHMFRQLTSMYLKHTLAQCHQVNFGLYCLLQICAESVQIPGNGSLLEVSHNWVLTVTFLRTSAVATNLAYNQSCQDDGLFVLKMPIAKWHSTRNLLQLSCCSCRTRSARLSSVAALLEQAPCTTWLQECKQKQKQKQPHHYALHRMSIVATG